MQIFRLSAVLAVLCVFGQASIAAETTEPAAVEDGPAVVDASTPLQYCRQSLTSAPYDPSACEAMVNDVAQTDTTQQHAQALMALAYGRAGDKELARIYADLASEGEPTTRSWQFLNDLSAARLITGDFVAAQLLAREALALAPEQDAARQNLILALRGLGDFSGARAEYTQLSRADRTNNGAADAARRPGRLEFRSPGSAPAEQDPQR